MLLQWNVWEDEDPKKVAAEIKKINPDIVCAQEIIKHSTNQINTAKYIAKIINYNYYYHKADTWSSKNDKDEQGNAIFSKLPIKKEDYKYLQAPKHNPKNAWTEGRVYIEITVEYKGKEVTIGTSHLSFTHKLKITKEKKDEVNKLLKIIKNKKENYLFAGDLNSAPNSYTVGEIEKYLNSAGPNYTQKTWPTKTFEYREIKENILAWRADYVFTSPDIRVKKAEVLKTEVSDHYPILVEIDM